VARHATPPGELTAAPTQGRHADAGTLRKEDGVQLITDSARSLDRTPGENDNVEHCQDHPLTSGVERTIEASEPSSEGRSVLRHAMLFGLVAVAALASLTGWLGFHAFHSYQAKVQRSQFLQTARQGALDLTTIDWQHADEDVQRILSSATGQFYDDFATRSKPFVDVVKQAKATSVGTIADAAVESQTAGTAQVLVAVAVKTSNAGAPDQVPRAWRLRIFVDKLDDQFKVSKVEFVP
jgi:Mce-associated membrane protein